MFRALKSFSLKSFMQITYRPLKILITLLLIFAAPSVVQAYPLLDGAKLIGFNGVSVDNKLFDVWFKEGTCAEVFGSCVQAKFTFTSAQSVSAAAQALNTQVFVDSAGGLFDSNPALTVGCNSIIFCSVLTPYTIDTPFVGTVTYAIFNNRSVAAGEDGVSFSGFDFVVSTVGRDDVWAVWTESTPHQSISEPSTLFLALAGTFILALRGYKHKF